jgi:hypothetical protein
MIRNLLTLLITIIIYSVLFILLDYLFVRDTFKTLHYRLGDTVSVFSLWNPVSRYRIQQYPVTSIAYQYSKHTIWPRQWGILNNIVQQYNIPKNEYLNIPIVVHLRLGDIIENHNRSVDDFWNGINFTLKMKYNHNGKNQAEGYIRPRQFYEKVHAYLETNWSGQKHILILTGSHKQLEMTKSKYYVDKVGSFFKDLGYTITIKISENCSTEEADTDFKLMCTSRVFIPSGGNFSRIATKCVKYNGGTVLSLSKLY